MAVAVVWQGNLCSCWWVFSCQNPHNLTSAGTCVRVELQSALVQRAKLQTHPAVVHAVLQHFKVLTDGKPAGRRWVTREQYIRYADVCDQTTEGVAPVPCRADAVVWRDRFHYPDTPQSVRAGDRYVGMRCVCV